MHHPRLGTLGVVGLILAACGPDTASKAQPAPAPTTVAATPPAEAKPPAPAPTPAGPGQLDADLVRAAGTAQGVEKIKVEVEQDGSIRYLSVYHQDAAAVPEPVRKQLEATYPGAKMLRYETETVVPHGRLHEIEVETADKQQCELSARADGGVVYTECQIDAKALPEAVWAAFDKAHPGAAIKEVEKKTLTGAGDEYEIEFETGGRLHELYFKPDGAVIRHELVLPAVIEVPA
ncbi:PepSY-like domain-containing protein [Nannocystis punicea]|uniref:PepSY-like domain-containing protein n=1 Tax=Nannocystis punicea TaxID=2995304 RepID=A0ABY7HGT4_9BACT|nr:PepSY-like domain-containing protein [Nannocystis poenicansa]WAS98313.1 PepSY-like domain-containing protein [Nannocystis poenicansa]